jgi:hypothetical protein
MRLYVKFISKWALIGFIVPCFWFVFWNISESYVVQNFKKLWLSLHILENITSPFSLLPLGDIVSSTPKYFLILQIMIGNSIFYSLLGTIFWLLYKLKK